MKASTLRGRGGAGFPTGMKWSFVPRTSPKPKYIMVNADESEPGTCKDRLLMEYDPHQMIEGMLIAGLAVDAHEGYIYIRGEYRYLIEIMDRAIAEAYARGYLGKNILGTGFDFDLYTHTGAGAYECGEESALLESLEGKRGIPRMRPPFPAVVGRVCSRPTVLNNVETFCAVPRDYSRWRRGVRGSGHAEERRHAAGLPLRARQQAGRLRTAAGISHDADDQGSRRRNAQRQEAEGGDSGRIVVPGAEGRRVRHRPWITTPWPRRKHARLGRHGGHGRRTCMVKVGAAHHAVLCARKLRLVHPVPRRHHLAAQNSAALSRRRRAARATSR